MDPNEHQHIEVKDGIVIPNWFLKVACWFGGLFVLWSSWVTITLAGISFMVADLHDLKDDVAANATAIVVINQKMENDDEREKRDEMDDKERDAQLNEIVMLLQHLTKPPQ